MLVEQICVNQTMPENLLGRGVQIELQPLVMQDIERIFALDQIEIACAVEDREGVHPLHIRNCVSWSLKFLK